MGEIQNQSFQLSFNASLKVDFQGSRVTSDGGLILVRELDERLGFGELIEQHLADSRRGRNTQLPLADLLRQSVYSRLAGYEDVNDAERLSQDPTFRLIGSEKIWERGAALTSRLQSFEMWLSVIAYNLGNLWRRLVLPKRTGHWSLTSLQQRLVKTGGRLIKHSRYFWLLLAESHLTRRLFGSMVRRIEALPVPAG
jgi:hypothetical protein